MPRMNEALIRRALAAQTTFERARAAHASLVVLTLMVTVLTALRVTPLLLLAWSAVLCGLALVSWSLRNLREHRNRAVATAFSCQQSDSRGEHRERRVLSDAKE